MKRLSASLFLARKDFQYLTRQRQSLIWLFLMPIIFFYFIGTITGGFSGSTTPASGEKLAVLRPPDSGFLADQLIERLKENDFQITTVERAAELRGKDRWLEIPEGFTQRILAGESAEIEFRYRGGSLSGDYESVRVARSTYTLLADVIAALQSGGVTEATLKALRDTPHSLQVRVAPAGERKEIPSGFEQAVPGTLVMFTLLVLLTTGSVTLVVERKQGLLRRLASTPIHRGSLVLGKWLGRMAVAALQILFAVATGTLLFGMDWGPDPLMVALVLTSWGALCASLGLVLGNVARSEGQAIGVGVLTSNVLAALGGCWWPIEITPGWMQALSNFLPTGWTMNALHRLISFQLGAVSALPYVLVLAAAALLCGWIAARIFRYQ